MRSACKVSYELGGLICGLFMRWVNTSLWILMFVSTKYMLLVNTDESDMKVLQDQGIKR